jgi:hypothetical protein
VTEHVSFGLSMQELHAMAAAERVRVRVCTRVFTLPPGSNAALRDLYTAIYRGIGGAADAATTTPDAGQ